MKFNMQEKVEKHDTLNPLLWNDDNTLKPEVEEKINEIVNDFLDGLKEDEIKINVKDIKLVGSNCSYNYNSGSDLDIHIVADTKSLKCPDNLYPLLYSAYRSIWNKNHDVKFYGIPVEIFIETSDTEQMSEPEEVITEAKEDKYYVVKIFGGYNWYEELAEIELYAKTDSQAKRLAIKEFKDNYEYERDDWGLKAEIVTSEDDDVDESLKSEYIDINDYFKLSDNPELGPVFITKEGSFINLGESDAHYAILNKMPDDFIDEYDLDDGFEKLMHDFHLVKANSGNEFEPLTYINAVTSITNNQEEAIKKWIDFIQSKGRKSLQFNMELYDLTKEVSDDIVKDIKKRITLKI